MDDTDRAILELEERFRQRATRSAALSREIGLAETPLAERLGRLLDDPAAMLEFPHLINSLRRARELQARPEARRAG
jgi:hypothetical protein